ncbi:hypothetical protein SLEP1_g31352 [Rubroshorea leprosula]|uniref:Uncharacterized protein n=1 Tax=Rubroshorea leprosula TaxID=152421 RepID=A0AAV5K342_9ROSI|nr:hypothetical protein SLEP1_g31352 [Rubroshorea leprosula]
MNPSAKLVELGSNGGIPGILDDYTTTKNVMKRSCALLRKSNRAGRHPDLGLRTGFFSNPDLGFFQTTLEQNPQRHNCRHDHVPPQANLTRLSYAHWNLTRHTSALPDQPVRQAHLEELDLAVGACLGVVSVVAAMRAAPAHFWVRARQIEEGAKGNYNLEVLPRTKRINLRVVMKEGRTTQKLKLQHVVPQPQYSTNLEALCSVGAGKYFAESEALETQEKWWFTGDACMQTNRLKMRSIFLFLEEEMRVLLCDIGIMNCPTVPTKFAGSGEETRNCIFLAMSLAIRNPIFGKVLECSQQKQHQHRIWNQVHFHAFATQPLSGKVGQHRQRQASLMWMPCFARQAALIHPCLPSHYSHNLS